MSRNYESIEIMKHKISMAQKIAQKDKDYALYAGASIDQAYIMSLIDWAKETKILSEETLNTIENYRKLLDFQRKAHIATTSTEITMLGFILGSPYAPKSAVKQ